jgi:hypothetical protein
MYIHATPSLSIVYSVAEKRKSTRSLHSELPFDLSLLP